jgi:GNAT superfamily N-acetyltransferase
MRGVVVIKVDIIEEATKTLPEYGRVSIAFDVRSILDVQPVESGLGGLRLSEGSVEHPWVKDYDAIKGEGAARWADRWDISNWGVIAAYVGNSRVGGCAIAYDTPGVQMLEERKDLAVIWDLRVTPHCRGQGIGGRLIEAAMAWARRRGCRVLKVETQNINVPACCLYARHGFTLGAINRYAYAEQPDEVQLIWHRGL